MPTMDDTTAACAPPSAIAIELAGAAPLAPIESTVGSRTPCGLDSGLDTRRRVTLRP